MRGQYISQMAIYNKDLPDTLNAQHYNDRSAADSNHQQQWSSEAAGRAAVNNPRGAERSTPASTPASTIQQDPSAEGGYYNVLCADGNFRRCKLVSAAWLADCPE